ncbi:hypothetical protein FGE12_00055 [Aggregicoccus sp. 17bor-14]|uniref:poly-gamma-glutamate biosynthesis protein PgsC/CapC n=1 Tax=Myxococcaceae TaxID=31 RepID=UPI00129CF350|nr:MULTISPECIES: poly-gamma-glutamate biosynthesis protein PgsC/CapC [Myxococcaceae]MBF5040769.1 poly-gamma-glutamate biosynthesis protein PgsC/CapC [Simulacricoccus sp. 17bor-14]MRI86557.1 hypothetical protein [Aggregicoccus sp. 17bor-14]
MALLSTLTLFPPYSLDTSILVAVLVGVLILALLTETLGWVFVGLVVPGYLASIFVINPEAGATVAVEALLTYGLAVLLSAGVSRTGAWSAFFGRDRFFLVVLASVLVRAVSEAWLLPYVGHWLDARFDTTFVLDRSLHSIGLVLVPLTANAFWKLKLRRGLLQVGVPVFLTYAVLRWVLLPGTNLSFGSLELVYEDIARSFLASPKAYIILLVTALLAARFNLLYGWDFNGILVPALLALTWLSPGKLLATVAEVLLLVLGTRAVLTLPGLRTANLEGPRKTVLVFTLGFVLKFCIGWALGGRVPGLKVTDLFGFGYLVPTLLAVKILQKQVVARIVLPSLHTSLAGFLLGSLIGFGLSLIEPHTAVATPEDARAEAPTLGLSHTPMGAMALARVTARENEGGDAPLRRRRNELRRYSVLWRHVDRWLETGSAEEQAAVQQEALRLGLDLRPLAAEAPGARPRFVLAERERLGGRLGWDTAVLVPGAPGPVLEVPRPSSEAPSAEAAAVLCERVQCRVLLVSGVDTRAAGLRQGDALLEEQTPLLRAHGALDAHPRILVRADAALPEGEVRLHQARAAQPAPGALWPGAHVTSEAPPEPGLAWEEGRVSVLRAHPRTLRAAVLARAGGLGPSLAPDALLATLSAPAQPPAAPGAAPAPAPSEAELAVLERQVAAPLLAAATPGAGAPAESAAREDELRWATLMASLMELQVRPVQGCGTPDGRCWLVTDAEGARGRLGAALLVRAGGAPLAVEAPTVGRDAGSLPVALEVWSADQGRALLLADAADAASPGNYRTAFQAFHQALHRSLPAEGGLTLQVRGFSSRPAVAADVLVELDGPVLSAAQRPRALEALLAPSGPLGWMKPLVRYHDGSPELAGLSDSSPQQAFSSTFGGAPFATLWLSEHLRGAYVGPRTTPEQLALAGFGPLPTDSRPPLESLLTPGLQPLSGAVPPVLREHFEQLAAAAERRLRQQNIHDLRALAHARTRAGVAERVEVAWSREQGLPYLLLEARQGRRLLRGVYFLQEELSPLPRVELTPGSPEVREAGERALRQRSPLLVAAELPAPAAGRSKEVRP